jgi:hypothetical protein
MRSHAGIKQLLSKVFFNMAMGFFEGRRGEVVLGVEVGFGRGGKSAKKAILGQITIPISIQFPTSPGLSS